jgi:hypothetical protein
LGAVAPAIGQEIRYAEPVQLAVAGQDARFEAYGRHFALTLTDNGRVLSKLPAQRKLQLQSYRLLRGAVDGQPGSWVRLTESADGVEGAIWDGQDLYAVTSYGRIAGQLTTPLSVAANQTVVYKLSDTRDALPKDFCGLGNDAVRVQGGLQKQNPLGQYRQMVGELQAAISAGTVTRQIEIALVADSAFAAAEPVDPVAAMLARLNIVEGIFSEQLGLLVLATDVRVIAAEDDPFTSTQAVTLLEQIGKYRAANPAVRARGLAHLMTGKNLDGTTAGIAYVGSACEAEHGVSLSERSYGTTISAIVMAHELGHNFGAPHDGEAGEACSTVAGGYIMSPTISGYANFSSCSVNVISQGLDAASCVTPADFADVALIAGSTLKAEGGVPFTMPFVVRSTGTKAAENVVFSIEVPANAGFTLDMASAVGAGCSVTALEANCEFGAIPMGEERSIGVTAHATIPGTVTARARVTASNDLMTSNNTRDQGVAIRSGVDAAVSVSTDAAEVPVGTPLTIFTEVQSKRALPVRNATLSLNLNQPVSAASMPGATCTTNTFSVVCTIAEIAPGASAKLTVNASATSAGPLFAAASVSAAGDGDITNNIANARAWVQAEHDVELTAGPATVDLAVGGAYEIPFLVRARGPQSTGDVTLWVTGVANAVSVSLIDAEGSTCTQESDGTTWRCTLGVVAPGSSRLIRLRVEGTRAGTVDINALAETVTDGYGANNAAGLQLRIDNPVDLAVLLASGGTGIEGQDIDGQVTLRSSGRDSATNATLDIEIHEAGVLRDASIHNGAACQLLDSRRARCPLPVMARGAQLYVDYRAQFAEPGTYDVKFTLQTPGDTAAANDTLTRPVLVRPYYDISVSGDVDLTGIVAGGTREATFTVIAGRRALSAARFTARHYLPGVTVNSIRASAGDCRVDEAVGGFCDFTDLAAGATVSVTVAWRADHACDQDVAVSVTTAGDVVPSNNEVRGRATVMAATDLELRVAGNLDGATGTTLDFPPISVVNGAEKALGARLEIALPAEVALVNVSAANAICSGTTVLSCEFAELEANSTSTVNLTVRASTRGNFSSALKLTSLNDTNPSNDNRNVAFRITASSPGPAMAAAKTGGGGGRFEWLALGLLAIIAARRITARQNGVRPHFLANGV